MSYLLSWMVLYSCHLVRSNHLLFWYLNNSLVVLLHYLFNSKTAQGFSLKTFIAKHFFRFSKVLGYSVAWFNFDSLTNKSLSSLYIWMWLDHFAITVYLVSVSFNFNFCIFSAFRLFLLFLTKCVRSYS